MLDSKRLGLAAGILWGLCVFIMTLIATGSEYGRDWLIVMKSIYPGYHISFGGSFVGLIYGFIDGYICLFLLSWVYNKLPKTK